MLWRGKLVGRVGMMDFELGVAFVRNIGFSEDIGSLKLMVMRCYAVGILWPGEEYCYGLRD